jgi:hypothetical protein
MKMMKNWKMVGLVWLSVGLTAGAETVVLFDGKSLDQWEASKGGAPGAGWVIDAEGALHRKEKSGDLVSKQVFGNFELEWEWKISEGGNSGLKYWVNAISNQQLGLEYQLIDDERHADALKGGKRQTAAIYDVKAAEAKATKPVGEWNQSRVVAKGGKLEHWLNGKQVVAVDTKTDAWREMLKASKFLKYMDQGFAPGSGRLLLQDHGDPVWFRNIVLKKLED